MGAIDGQRLDAALAAVDPATTTRAMEWNDADSVDAVATIWR